MTDVAVIGAGASGLMCGITAGRRGRSVLIIEHTGRIGSKILISGGGRCNFTNLSVETEHYISENPRFCTSALKRFTQHDFISLLEEHGIPYHEEDEGKLFCDRTARDIVDMLDRERREAGVEVRLGCIVSEVRREDRGFIVTTGFGPVRCASLVVATGGLSYRSAGATPYGYEIAREFGIPVIDCRPALVPFTWTAGDRVRFRDLSGIALTATLRTGGAEFYGRLLFTHRGLSGPAALQLSTYWKAGDPVSIDFVPETDVSALLSEERRRGSELETVLRRILPRRLVRDVFGDLTTGRVLARCTDRDIADISDRLHDFTITPGGTEGYEKAEVTSGGVDTGACSSKTMEARSVPGLYFVGEVLDVTGRLGGYNLQWAWSSGHAAGLHA